MESSKSEATKRSYTDLYDAHVDELYRFIHLRCRDHGLAEDITQETFLSAIRSRQPEEISIGWLKTVARNRLFDVLRRQRNFASKLRLVGAAEDDEHEAQLAERLHVEAALESLSLDHRIVLTLHYLDGLTIPEMATHLDRSMKSVEGLVTRARRQLRRELGDDHV